MEKKICRCYLSTGRNGLRRQCVQDNKLPCYCNQASCQGDCLETIYAQYDDLQPSEHNLFHLYCIICRDGEFCAYNKHKYILALSTTILQALGWIGNPRPECFYIRSILWVLCPSLSLSWSNLQRMIMLPLFLSNLDLPHCQDVRASY